MLNLPRWQVIAIIVVTVLAGLFALPNVLPGSVLDHAAGLVPRRAASISASTCAAARISCSKPTCAAVLNERLTNLSDSVRGELRKQQIAFKDVDRRERQPSVTVVLRDEAQRAKAIEAMRTIDPVARGRRRRATRSARLTPTRTWSRKRRK